MLIPTKILVPTDFSEYSDKALTQAFDIAIQYKAKVYVLHVVNGESYYDDLERQMIEGARRKLQEEIDKFPQTKELEVFAVVVSGNTSESILAEERSKEIDLIVIASLGQSGIAKYLIGSVARNVLKGANCPVLLTK